MRCQLKGFWLSWAITETILPCGYWVNEFQSDPCHLAFCKGEENPGNHTWLFQLPSQKAQTGCTLSILYTLRWSRYTPSVRTQKKISTKFTIYLKGNYALYTWRNGRHNVACLNKFHTIHSQLIQRHSVNRFLTLDKLQTYTLKL